MSSKSKRVYKNIVFLYIRMMVLMFVTLYTSRVILEALGVVDLGISNVVGAVIVMLSFINNSMALAVNRFLAFELGKENWHKLRKVFCISVNIHILMALIVVVLGETIGLWFI
ncbi:MAG: lipopolysaccharide biosynthesis protein, partial [Odoribacter sp.]|nr:lipopolysaccharide biosynthesis protein [Odoribacter sp.]